MGKGWAITLGEPRCWYAIGRIRQELPVDMINLQGYYVLHVEAQTTICRGGGMERDVQKMVMEAMQLSDAVEDVLSGQDYYVILMALTKVSGCMLAEVAGMGPDFQDENTAADWFRHGVIAAYRGHVLAMRDDDSTMH
jgi:hypothetical protein